MRSNRLLFFFKNVKRAPPLFFLRNGKESQESRDRRDLQRQRERERFLDKLCMTCAVSSGAAGAVDAVGRFGSVLCKARGGALDRGRRHAEGAKASAIRKRYSVEVQSRL